MTDICYTLCIPETFQITIKKNFSFKKVFLMSHCFGFGRFGYDSSILEVIAFVQFVHERF